MMSANLFGSFPCRRTSSSIAFCCRLGTRSPSLSAFVTRAQSLRLWRGSLSATKRGRGCTFHSHVRELARSSRVGEVDRSVAARAPAQERGVGATRPFHEHLLDRAD